MKTPESYQTYLDIQLNHILSHSVNTEKITQNHLKSHEKQHLMGTAYEILPVLA